MSRIPTPSTIETSPAPSQPLLKAVKQQLGSVPNLHRMIGNSPASLGGYLALGAALGRGDLDVRTRNRIALTVAQENGCDYCLSAHTYLGRNLAKLDDAEMALNRDATSSDPRAAAAVRFAAQVVRARGHVADAELTAIRAAGFSDGEILEVVAHVALNTLTNYVNTVAGTDIDFPLVSVHDGK